MAPVVLLGEVGSRSVAATVFGLLDRGAALRPELAEGLEGRVRLAFREDYADVLIERTADGLVVRDDDGGHEGGVDLVIRASLPDLVLLIAAPLARGLPKPTHAHGRAALARVARGDIEVSGPVGLARRVLQLLSVAPGISPRRRRRAPPR